MQIGLIFDRYGRRGGRVIWRGRLSSPRLPSRSLLAFLTTLPLMWAALRRNQRDTATIALLSCFAVWGTISNAGPLVRSSLNESFLLLLAFMISVSVPSLALSADVAVRRRHQEHVNFVMHELSHRSKNLLSIVQSMANQVARQTDSFDDFRVGFSRRLFLLSQKVAANDEENHLFGKIHTSAMGVLKWICQDRMTVKHDFRFMWRGSRA